MKLNLEFFVHPVPLSAVALMAVNDHWLKYLYPGWFTGKLSDFAGIFYFPIFVLALAAVALQLFGVKDSKRIVLSRGPIVAAIAFTDVLLLLVKLSAPAASFIENFFQTYLFSIRLVQDPTDLWALWMNLITWWYLARQRRNAARNFEPLQT